MYDDEEFKQRREKYDEIKSRNSLRCRIFRHKWERKIKHASKICDRCGAYKKYHE